MRTSDGEPLRPIHNLRAALARSSREFLRVPLVVVGVFIALAAFAIVVDVVRPGPLGTVHRFFEGLVPEESAPDLLTTIAQSVVTIASITFSVLLLAVQQAASSFTGVVFDQYLRRKSNQLYFGFFVGLAVYSFLVLAAVRPDAVPAFGTGLALGLTVVAMVLLVGLIYGTVDQMRPSTVVRGIHELALRARSRHLPLIASTRNRPRASYRDPLSVRATDSGFVTAIDVAALARTAGDVDGEVLLDVRIGSHVAYGEPVARVAGRWQGRGDIAPRVLAALRISRARRIESDPAYAVEQLGNVAWVAASSAQHNPEASVTAIRAMADLLARWEDAGEPGEGELPVVYEDRVTHEALDILTGLAIVSAESRQHQSCAEVLFTVARLLPFLEPDELVTADSAVRRMMPSVIEHALSVKLEVALHRLADALDAVGCSDAADAARAALDQLAAATRELFPKPSDEPQPAR